MDPIRCGVRELAFFVLLVLVDGHGSFTSLVDWGVVVRLSRSSLFNRLGIDVFEVAGLLAVLVRSFRGRLGFE